MKMVRLFIFSVMLFFSYAWDALATTYVYTGLNYNSVTDFTPPCTTGPCSNYTMSMKASGYFTTATPLPPNLVGSTIAASDVTSYSFSDGINTYTNTDPNARIHRIQALTTDASGRLTGYQIMFELWQSGTSPHAVNDRFAYVYVTTSASFTRNNDVCSLVGNSYIGVPDSCNSNATDSQTSVASSNVPGTWTVPPSAPTIGTATPGDGSATVSFTPGSDGGFSITGYTVSCTDGGSTFTGTGTASPIAVTGLTNGTAYSCSVTATNNYPATSAPSGTVSVTPMASQAITGFAATPASGTVGGSSTLSVTGSGASGNPVVYASATTGICTVSGNTVSFVAVGTCTVTADQAGNANYSAASQVNLNIAATVTGTAIPTLSQWAMALLMGLLGLSAWAARRCQGLGEGR